MNPLLRRLPLLFLASLPAVAAPADDVLAAEHARRAALLAADAGKLSGLLSDDLRYVHSTGKVESKSDILAGFNSGKVAYERFDLSGLDVRVITPEVAVVTGTIEQRKLNGGKWNDLKLLFQAVWRRESGSWRQVGIQTVQPPAPRSP